MKSPDHIPVRATRFEPDAVAADLPEVMPPTARGSMTPLPWAGFPLLRPLRAWLGYRPRQPWRQSTDRRPLMLRRVMLLALVLAGAAAGTQYMVDVLPDHGSTLLEQGLLVLFGILFAWISAGFWTALMGAWVMLRGDRRSLRHTLPGGAADRSPIDPAVRTAIIMPICNEHVATVFAGVRATYESLRATGQLGNFDFFILSDTSRPDIRAAEQAAWAALNESLGLDAETAQGRLHYRWRQHRRHRKTGNVADFCRRWGHDYRYMIVLDADSVMSGDCLTTLVRLMEAHPDTGIIQTAPRAFGHDTLHARAQQFGSRVYGPLFTAGLHFWQLGESHYWGHNAILRIEPFMQHCALAPIKGSGSLAGDIMSHDFVEAALIRRAGWKVWIAHDLGGSYEQVPPNLIAEVQRDRRWCHGNLQNSRLMFEPGLHPVHRSVFLTGVLAYLSAPLWLCFLLLSTLLFVAHTADVPRYFLESYQLFPIWPTANLQLMLTLFGLTAMLLLVPKLMALALLIVRGEARRYGGVARLLIGGLIEFLQSMLLAPVRMLFHTQFVLAALTGWKMDWKSPPREDDSTPWREALRRMLPQTLLAVVWIGALLLVGNAFPWWLSPILIGLLLSAPMAVWTSRRGPGLWLRRHGVLVTPEELRMPAVLVAAERYAAEAGSDASFRDAVLDPVVHRRVIAATPSVPEPHGDKALLLDALVQRAIAEGPAALSDAERLRLLSQRHALAALRRGAVQGSSHPGWRPEHSALPLSELRARRRMERPAAHGVPAQV